MFIAFLYMFRATTCPSSGEHTVPMRHLVFVTLYRWLPGMQGGFGTLAPHIFFMTTAVFPPSPPFTYENAYQFTCAEQKGSNSCVFHGALLNSGSSLWNLSHVIFLSPTIWKRFLDFFGRFVDPRCSEWALQTPTG